MQNSLKLFFTPLKWNSDDNIGILEKSIEKIDDYFYFPCFWKKKICYDYPEKARIIKKGSRGDYTVQLLHPYWWEVDSKNEFLKAAGKILSLGIRVKRIPVIPVIGILSKALFRFMHHITDVRLSDEKIEICKSRIFDIQDSFLNEKKEITNGHGEFIVYKLNNNVKEELDENEYVQIFSVLNENRKWNNSRVDRPRDQELTEILKSIDPAYEAAFVPRTLYELMVIRKALEEDIEYGGLCPKTYPEYEPSEQASHPSRSLCWHEGSFKNQKGDSNHPHIRRLALETNNIFIHTIPYCSLRFSNEDIQRMTEDQLQFFYQFHVNSNSEMSKQAARMSDTLKHGLVIQFSQDIDYCPIRSFMRSDGTFIEIVITPMGISQKKIADIYRNSIALECSPLAATNAFLMRGGNLQADYPVSVCTGEDEVTFRSLSYSSSLLSGAFFSYDCGESVAYHGTYDIRTKNEENNHTFAMPVPYKDLEDNDSLFFTTHAEHPIVQLKSYGEYSHTRSLLKRQRSGHYYKGLFLSEALKFLFTDLSKDAFCDRFEKYRENAIILSARKE